MAFPNGYFRLSFRDFVIAIVSRETWWFIGVVGVSRGTSLLPIFMASYGDV